MRHLPTSTPEHSNQQHCSEQSPQLTAYPSHFVGEAEIETALSFLEEHVAAEEDGTVSIYLCDVVLETASGSPVTQKIEEIAAAPGLIHLEGLQERIFEESGQQSTQKEKGDDL